MQDFGHIIRMGGAPLRDRQTDPRIGGNYCGVKKQRGARRLPQEGKYPTLRQEMDPEEPVFKNHYDISSAALTENHELDQVCRKTSGLKARGFLAYLINEAHHSIGGFKDE
jgi:hypothetical protein